MPKENLTFYNMCNNLFRLENGTYQKENDIKIKIYKNSYGLNSYIHSKNIELEIDLHRNGQYYTTVKFNEDAVLYQSATSRGDFSKRIGLKINNDNFNIFEYQITKNGEKVCDIINNTLLKKINDNCYIAYSFNNFKTYICYKKNGINNEKDYLDVNNNFIKFDYNERFINTCKDYIKDFDKNINSFKDLISDTKFKEIIETILNNPLKDNLCPDIKELEFYSLVEMYSKYKNMFNILDDGLVINDIYEFTNQIINDPIEREINNIKNLMNDTDIKDIDALKKLRNKIDSYIDYQQNNIKKKTK